MRRFLNYYWVPILFAFLVIGVYITYYPHLSYPYTFHVDEWEHFTMAEEATITGRLPTYKPYLKSQPDAGTLKWEWNYHSLLAVFFEILPFQHEFTMIIIPAIHEKTHLSAG